VIDGESENSLGRNCDKVMKYNECLGRGGCNKAWSPTYNCFWVRHIGTKLSQLQCLTTKRGILS